jgi:ERF superfamily
MTVSPLVTSPTAADPDSGEPGQTVQTVAVPEPAATGRNLYQRINAVRRALGGTISKNGQAPQVMGGFTFVTWDDVGARVGTLLAENGIVTLPSMTACEVVQAGTTANGKPIYRATVTLVYEFVNADEPSERTTMTWVGSGDDSGDKAIQKAATSGSKYLFLKLFMLGGADDAERNGEDAKVDHLTATATTKQRPTNGSKPKVVAKTPTGRGCPDCGGDLEHVRWDNGGEKIACTNWRECRYRENVVPAPADEQS